MSGQFTDLQLPESVGPMGSEKSQVPATLGRNPVSRFLLTFNPVHPWWCRYFCSCQGDDEGPESAFQHSIVCPMFMFLLLYSWWLSIQSDKRAVPR